MLLKAMTSDVVYVTRDRTWGVRLMPTMPPVEIPEPHASLLMARHPGNVVPADLGRLYGLLTTLAKCVSVEDPSHRRLESAMLKADWCFGARDPIGLGEVAEEVVQLYRARRPRLRSRSTII